MTDHVLYRKHRPKTFGGVLGQDHVVKILKNALKLDRVAHAYLFSGSRGTGKTSVARILARAINCEKNEPCNSCQTCVDFMSGRTLDLVEIDATSNRGIDEIRAIRDAANFLPVSAKRKVYIIDEVHMLTAEAFNALLKTLEEPPNHVIFILCTTEPHKVPATIASRCFHISFKKATKEELVRSFTRIAKKEKISVDKDALESISDLSDGSFRDGVKILEEIAGEAGNKKITKEMVEKIYKVTNIDHQIDKMIEFFSQKNAKEAMLMVGKVTEEGIDIKYFMEKLMLKLHDLMLIEIGVSKEKSDIDLNIEDIKTLMDLLTKAHGKLKYSVLSQLPLEIAIIEWSASSVFALPYAESDARKDSAEVAHNPPKATQLQADASSPRTKSSDVDLLQELINKVKTQNHSIAGVLRGCTLKSYDGKKFIIEAKFKFHKEKLDEAKSKILLEKTLEEIEGKRLPVSVVLKF